MVETELVVKIASGGAGQTVRDVLGVQKAIAQLGKDSKDTAALAKQLGSAFNLPDGEVRALADALAQAKAEATGVRAAFAQAAQQFGLIGKETQEAAGKVGQLSGEVAKARDRLKDSFKFKFDLDDKAASGLIDDFQRLQTEGADLNTIFSTLGKSYGITAGQVAKVAASFGDLNQAVAAQSAAAKQLSGLQTEVSGLTNDIEALQRVSQNSGLDFEGARRFSKELGLTSQQADLVIQRFRELKGVSPEAQFQVLSRELGVTGDQFKKLERQIKDTSEASKGFNGAIAGLAAGAAFAAIDALTGALQAAGQAFAGFIASTLEVGGAAQQADVAFTTILGGAEEAQSLLAELSDFAATTPFDLPGVRSAGQQLLAFGFQSDQITENLRRVGDVAAGVNTDFGELATIYGKARVQGRLFAEDINQLTERGIPIIGELAEQFGVTETEVRNLVSEGKVGFAQLEQAFISMTGEGGQFSGLMEAQSKTIPGQVSNISDGFVRLQEALFNAFEPALAGGLGALSGILTEVGEQSQGFDGLAAASERLGAALANNPEIVESLGAAFAGLADTAIDQLSQILDALTAFLSTEGNVAQIADQIEALGGAITAVGQGVRFLIALADGTGKLISAAEGLPVIGDNLDRFLKFPVPFNLLAEALRLIGEVIVIVKDAVIDAVDGTLDRAKQILPVLNPIITKIQGVLGLLRTDPAGAATALDGIPGALTKATAALGTAGEAVDKLADKKAAPVVDPKPAEDGLKRITDANKAATDSLSTDAANARAAILEAGGDPAKLAALEAQTLRDRIQNNRDFLKELTALQSGGGLSVEDAAAVADQIRGVEGQLASDRVSLAQQTLAEKQRTEKAAADAAKAAAEAKAKAETDALKKTRDEEKRLADQAQADREKAAQREFDDSRDGRAETRDAQRRAEDKALQEALQADDRQFQNERRESDRAFQQQQQTAAEAFQQSQQAAAEAFQRRLDAERDQGGREFDVLGSEVDKRLQLAQADSTQRAELLKQFEEERKTLELRRQIEKEVLGQKGQVLSENQGALELSPLEAARAAFEEQLQAKQKAFQESQQAAAQAFQESQALADQERSDAQRIEDEKRADDRQAADEERDAARQKADAEFEDNERKLQDNFELQQRNQKEAFNAQQRQLDEASAQRIAAILAAAKPRGIDGARRDGGPVKAGGSYLVGEEGPEIVTMRRGGYVHTARETAAMMAGVSGRGGVTVAQPSTGAVEAKLDRLISVVESGRKVQAGPTSFVLQSDNPVADAVGLQLEQIRQMVRGGGL